MKATTRNRLDHSMSIIVSIVVNGLLFVGLLTFIQMSGEADKPISTVMVIEPTDQEVIEEVKKEIIEEIQDPTEINENLEYSMDNVMETDFTTETEAVDTPAETDVSEITDLLSDIASPVVMSGLMVGRTELGRKAMLGRYGGGMGGISEPAVNRALQWLKDHQKPDGSWSPNGDTKGGGGNAGISGLALLAFLAHGETPSSAEYGATVGKAIRWIVERQNSKGYFFTSGHQVYGHAIATYAIAEAYTVTENALLKEPLEKAVKVILDGQQPNGGYDYNYKGPPRNDSSVGGWQIQALKAASIAGINDPRLPELLQKAMDGMLVNSQEREGKRGIGYTSPGFRDTISAAGTLCMHFVGRGESKESKQLMNYLAPYVPDWDNTKLGGHGGAIYLMYYVAQAKFHADPGGNLFKEFNRHMVNEYAKNQNADGSWTDPTEGGQGRGPVMNTAMAALTLMVYYRHLPTGQHDNIKPMTPAQQTVEAADEDLIQFAL